MQLHRLMFILVAFVSVAPFASSALAQNPNNMNPQQMQEMMKKAAEMQACFANVNVEALQKVADKGKKVEQEVKTLCQNGDHSGAMSKAIQFATEMNKNNDVQALRKCGEQMAGMVPEIPYADFAKNAADITDTPAHICDAY